MTEQGAIVCCQNNFKFLFSSNDFSFSVLFIIECLWLSTHKTIFWHTIKDLFNLNLIQSVDLISLKVCQHTSSILQIMMVSKILLFPKVLVKAKVLFHKLTLKLLWINCSMNLITSLSKLAWTDSLSKYLASFWNEIYHEVYATCCWFTASAKLQIDFVFLSTSNHIYSWNIWISSSVTNIFPAPLPWPTLFKLIQSTWPLTQPKAWHSYFKYHCTCHFSGMKFFVEKISSTYEILLVGLLNIPTAPPAFGHTNSTNQMNFTIVFVPGCWYNKFSSHMCWMKNITGLPWALFDNLYHNVCFLSATLVTDRIILSLCSSSPEK